MNFVMTASGATTLAGGACYLAMTGKLAELGRCAFLAGLIGLLLGAK